jgi:hypothetical protein
MWVQNAQVLSLMAVLQELESLESPARAGIHHGRAVGAGSENAVTDPFGVPSGSTVHLEDQVTAAGFPVDPPLAHLEVELRTGREGGDVGGDGGAGLEDGVRGRKQVLLLGLDRRRVSPRCSGARRVSWRGLGSASRLFYCSIGS